MKVLFLDIDGVANCSTTTVRHRGFIGIDRWKAFLIGKIQLDTGCEIVLSSSWRKYDDGRKEVERVICAMYDVTPIMPRPEGTSWEYNERGREIKAWLDAHPNVTRYAIVDDDNDMLPEQQEHFFKTDYFGEGLTDEIAARITAHLNRCCGKCFTGRGCLPSSECWCGHYEPRLEP